MPDNWESQYGLDPSDPSDASADPDNDGKTNLQEYQAGTDPTVAGGNVAEGGLGFSCVPVTAGAAGVLLVCVLVLAGLGALKRRAASRAR
jgi:hypothetical protein